VKRYTQHLLNGLSYLHSQGIVHRDIKCANLLVDRDGCVKLSDFGACKRLGALQSDSVVSRTTSLRGSPYWMSPEVVLRTGHSYSADIWSVGCTLIEMLTATPPWSDLTKNSREVLKLIAKGPPKTPPTVSLECQDFLSLCFKVDSSQRPTAKQLLEHPFIAEAIELDSGLSRSSARTVAVR
jgi:serine/threonine protein kinase